MMKTVTGRLKLRTWAQEAGVSEAQAEKLLTLSGLAIEPAPDELTLLVREIGAAMSGTPGVEHLWNLGDYDRSPRADAIRILIDKARAYERRRIIGDAEFQTLGDGSFTFDSRSIGPMLSRLAGDDAK